MTTYGHAGEPRLAWNGSDFAILFARFSTEGNYRYTDLEVMKLDREGTVLVKPWRLHRLPHYNYPLGYDPFLVSDLVWNPDHEQFALAYSYGKEVYLARLNSNLGMAYPFVKIDFPGLNKDEHPHMVDVSLAWNPVRQEYGLTCVTQEDPYDEDRHNDIYLWQIRADGSMVDLYGAAPHIMDCPDDCWRTSLASNRASGDYAVAYYKGGGPSGNPRAMLAIVDPSNRVSEHHILSDWAPAGARPIRVHFDPYANDYLVVATSLGGSIVSQVVHSDGSSGDMASTSPNGTYGWYYSQANFPSRAHTYLLCATTDWQIHCWVANHLQHFAEDVVYPPDGTVKRYEPSLRFAEDKGYLSWVEGNSEEEANLFFGWIGE